MDGDVEIQVGQAVRRILRLAPDVHARLARHLGVGTSDLLALDRMSSHDESVGIVELGTSLGDVLERFAAAPTTDPAAEAASTELRPG